MFWERIVSKETTEAETVLAASGLIEDAIAGDAGGDLQSPWGIALSVSLGAWMEDATTGANRFSGKSTPIIANASPALLVGK